MRPTEASGTAAEAMDRIYRRQRFIYDATRRYYLLGRDRLIANLDVPTGGKVLEVGCGTARNLIHAARVYPDASLFGIDISEAMLTTARTSLEAAGLGERVKLAAGDAATFDPGALFGVEKFERIFISYSLSMIPEWQAVVRHAAACLSPGGALLIVDFGDFAGYPALFRRAQLAWLKRFSVHPIPLLDQRLKELAAEAECAFTATRRYGGYAIECRLRAAATGLPIPNPSAPS
jgi:S-adenosylmethionine-diacylgycerolhomoserine-N-methlytransferase